jgi:hypothetical protein
LNDLPLAFVPLWQLLQLPAATPLWFIVAGFQPVVPWQVSQLAFVVTWLFDLPFAFVPL